MAFRSATDRVILVAVESVYGTAPTMNAATAILAMGASVRVVGDQLARDLDTPHFGGDPFVIVGKRIELDFEVDLLGNATPGSAAPLGAVYRACGHSQTLVPYDVGPPEVLAAAEYRPVSTGQASATVDFYWAGVRFRMTGARGSMDVSWEIKNYAKAAVKLVGILTLPTDSEPPGGIDFSAFQPPAAIETPTWTVNIDPGSGDYDAHCTRMTLAQGGETPLIETSQSRQVIWTDRKPTGELIVIKDAALSVFNPWALADAHTIVALTSTLDGGAGRRVISTVRAQLGYAEPTEVEKVAALRIPYTAVPSGAGNDEYRHTFR